MSKPYYGVSQYSHGAEHVWVFDKPSLIREMPKNLFEGVRKETDLGGIYCEDILWPIGGSNSSATFIEKLDGLEAAREFLVNRCDGPDLEDPMLVDLAEYYRAVEVDEGSITQKILDHYGLKAEDLTQTDDRIEKLLELGYTNADFYGDKRDLRYSEAIGDN